MISLQILKKYKFCCIMYLRIAVSFFFKMDTAYFLKWGVVWNLKKSIYLMKKIRLKLS